MSRLFSLHRYSWISSFGERTESFLTIHLPIKTSGSSTVISSSRCPRIGASVALDYMESLAVGVTVIVQPPSVVESDPVDYQCVSFPFTDRVPGPGWIWILGMVTTVQEDLAETRLLILEHQD